MAIDKELYRRAYAWYREWNEAEFVDRVRNAGTLTPQETWRQYVDLWEFALRIAPPPGEQQRQRRWADVEEYYARIRKFEAWRRAHGKKT